MRVKESIDVPTPVDRTWAFLWEVDRVVACLPGCKSAQTVEEGSLYRAEFEDKIGPYKIESDVEVKIEQAVRPEAIRLAAIGKDRRFGTTQQITLDLTLAESGGGTVVAIEAEVTVLGRIGTFGQFAVNRKIKSVVHEFAANLQREIQAQ